MFSRNSAADEARLPHNVKEEIGKALLALIRCVPREKEESAAAELVEQSQSQQSKADSSEASSASPPAFIMCDVLSSRAVCACMSACQWLKGRQGMLAIQEYLQLETKLGAGLSAGTPKDFWVSWGGRWQEG
jgi:hypothetical protein